jgi:apolipoprotein N-acyltransferase
LGLVLSFVLAYGVIRLNQDFTDSKNTLKVSVIEPDIAQGLKWDPAARIYILQTLRDLSFAAASENPDMIIWPESAVPDFFTDDPLDFVDVTELAKVLNKSILTGVVKDSQDKYYNSALLISGQGNIVKEYDKLHLVPYGEFIPFRRLTPYLAAVVGIGDFTPGEEYTIFSIGADDKSSREITFAALICFEDAFPELSRRFIKKGALILVNITNDAWFGRGAQPRQHLSQSVFRAVENRTSVVRSANTGISGLIDAKGRASIIGDRYCAREDIGAGFKTFRVQAKSKNFSFYSLYGDCFAYICVILVLANFIFLSLGKKLR